MARVTVEDCVDKVTNRFELVMVAAQRARRIGTGAQLTIDRDNDKNPVVALREIAEETVEVDTLKEELIKNNQRVLVSDEEEDVNLDGLNDESENLSLMQAAAAESTGMYSDDIEAEEEAEMEAEDDSAEDEDIISAIAGN